MDFTILESHVHRTTFTDMISMFIFPVTILACMVTYNIFMDIILVQTQAPDEVQDANFLAQVSQQGGGTSEDLSRPRELFSAPTISTTPGISEQNSVQQIRKQKQQEQVLLLSPEYRCGEKESTK